MQEPSATLPGMRLLLALSALACGACVRPGAPCVTEAGCPGRECLASRCSEVGSDPVPRDAARAVIPPSAAAVSGRGTLVSTETVTLGATSGRAERLYLDFEQQVPPGLILAAFLLLTPAKGAPQTSKRVPLLVREIDERWTPARVQAGAPPRLGPARASGIAKGRPAAQTRIDVTALFTGRSPTAEHHGLAVLADGSAGEGVTFLSGPGSGAPRLEIYSQKVP